MSWSLARLKTAHLIVLTAAYWIGLIAAKLGGAIIAGVQVSLLPSGQGSITASLEGTLLRLTIAKSKAVIWSGSASLGTILLWVAGPPLLLALTRRWTRELDEAAGSALNGMDAGSADRTQASLPAPGWPSESPQASKPTAKRPGAAS